MHLLASGSPWYNDAKVGINVTINQEASSWLVNSTFVAGVYQVSDNHLDGVAYDFFGL
jgi:hypothetical protein